MLFETYDIDPRHAQIVGGLLLGLIFGVAAQASRFCLRRAVAGAPAERGSAASVWVFGLAVAIAAFAVLKSLGYIDLGDHRYLSADLPVLMILLGGAAFGIGMVLTRGCISRLTVLSATGNLRAVFVLMAFAVTAHATTKGVLAPLRTQLAEVSVALPFGTLADTGFGTPLLLILSIGFAGILIQRFRPTVGTLVLGGLIGLVAALGWAATSIVLLDEFDPAPIQSVAFTLPWNDTLFWLIASSAIPAGFGVGLIAGVLAGSFLSASVRGELSLQSFTSPAETLRYVAGGMLMGLGGVLAGGCTVGAGLSGVATGSVAAILTLVTIAISGWITGRAMQGVRASAALA